MHGKQEIECQGALFAPDGGLRVSLKGTERQNDRDRRKDNKTEEESEKREERGEDIGII